MPTLFSLSSSSLHLSNSLVFSASGNVAVKPHGMITACEIERNHVVEWDEIATLHTPLYTHNQTETLSKFSSQQWGVKSKLRNFRLRYVTDSNTPSTKKLTTFNISWNQNISKYAIQCQYLARVIYIQKHYIQAQGIVEWIEPCNYGDIAEKRVNE